MTHEIALLPRSEPYTEKTQLLPQIRIQIDSIQKLQQSNIHKGVMQVSGQDFCALHFAFGQNCKTCTSQNLCERCCYRFNVFEALPSTELIIKTGDCSQKEMHFEALIQQKLFQRFPENVPQCIGNYEEFCYYIRKIGSLKWFSAKICVYVENFEDRLRNSCSSDLASQKKFTIDFDELCEKINECLFELAILFNTTTFESEIQLRVDWRDRDYCRKHNFFIVSNDTDGDENDFKYVFFDFGHNLCRSAS